MRFSFRSSNARICCETDKPEALCDSCKARASGQPQSQSSTESFVPPDPYQLALDKLKETRR